jgi:YggT family protein
MQTLLDAFDYSAGLVRIAFLGVAAVLAVVCVADWLVRTRKLPPFGPTANFMRRTVDPLLRPIEQRVVRAGGQPSSAPWWALGAVILVGIILITLIGFVRSQLGFMYYSLSGGAIGIYRLVVTWVFALLQLAVIIRVLISWLPVSPSAWYSRWSHALTEPMLKPLRRIIPLIGSVDITPIVAWFLLGVIEGFLVRL